MGVAQHQRRCDHQRRDFQGLTIDGLPRSLWYTPQHAGACALGLVALTVLAAAGSRSLRGARLLAGVALALAVTFSPFLGAAFSLVYALAVVVDAARRPRHVAGTVLGHWLPALPVVLAVGWVLAGGVVDGAGGALVLGFSGLARRAPIVTLLLTLGPLLLPAILGGLTTGPGWWRVVPSAAGLFVGLGLFYLVSLAGTDPVWVGWRAGQILLVTLPALAARFTAEWWTRRRLRPAMAAAVTLAFLVGLPTTIIDTHNAQDVSNKEMGVGFPWTVRLTPDEQQAFEWMRRATPRDAVVQAEPILRGRSAWTHIPSFGQRRMAGGLPISLVATEYRRDASQRVRRLYETMDPQEAWALARELKIDYLYVDHLDRATFPAASLTKFDGHPELFPPAFRNPTVTIYAVAGGS